MKKIYLFLFAILLGSNLRSFAQTFTFAYTGSATSWTVPSGVTSIGFQAQGAMGGLNSTEMSSLCSGTLPDRQGYGACVKGTLAVTPGEVLNIYVGGQGTAGTASGCIAVAGVGGFNGGGNGAIGYGSYSGGGGGGESDIRAGGTLITNAVVVAAGGGGAGGNYYFSTDFERGGDGGTTTGEDGYGDAVPFANGGAQGGGPGSGGLPGSYPGWGTGASGVQGAGGNAGTPSGGGGGGAGWWGGGGGCWGGGGGGSSYTDPVQCSAVTQTRGCNSTTDGSIVLCLTDPGTISGMKPVCVGQTITLTESKPGGIWSASNTCASVSSAGVVTGLAGGLVTISYTLATPCAVAYAVVTLTIVNSPVAIAGPSIICVGGTPMFTDATPAGVWSISNSAVASISAGSGVADGIYPGSATITYTLPVAGCFTTMPVSVVGIGGPHSVCTGSSVALILPVGGGGAWSSSNTFSASVDTTGLVRGLSIGTSTISYSSALCPESIVMTVNPIAPLLGADSVCVTSSVYYTDIVGIGTWTSSNSAVAAVTPATGLVGGVGAGTAVITFTSPAGCTADKNVSVIALPPPITGTMEVCQNATTALHDPLAGGVWSSADAAIASVSPGGVVTGLTPDTTSIVYTILPGCSTGAIVIVNPLPVSITGRDTICPGVIDTFQDASRGGLWSSTTAVQDTIVDTTGILTSRLSGFGVINYTLPTGCTVAKTIYIYPIATPLITYNKFDNTLYTDPIYVGYQWYDSISGPLLHANSPSLAGVYSQWYYVVVTDTNGCKSPSAKFEFNNAITGVKNVGGINVKVFPNPVTGILYIESPVSVRAVINGIDGKMEMDQNDAKEMDISRLAPGVYLITLYDDSGTALTVQKIIKE